jgi:hypothetical protein
MLLLVMLSILIYNSLIIFVIRLDFLSTYVNDIHFYWISSCNLFLAFLSLKVLMMSKGIWLLCAVY